MPDLTDAELFDFDKNRLAHWDEARVAEALEEFPELYRNHLTIAIWMQGWAERLEEDADSEFARGYARAVREVTAHLRQADLVPGGALLLEI